MKPRLRLHLGLTQEDSAIRNTVAARQVASVMGWKCWLDIMRSSDRRDAGIMLAAQKERFYGAIGWLPGLADCHIEPYPYSGGVRLGCKQQWESDCAQEPDQE